MNTFYDIIYKWVADNFGQSEADDPSWDIKALAEHLSKSDIKPDELSAYTKHCVYNDLDQRYVEEDVEYHAENHGYKLTDAQIGAIASEVRDSDWYCSVGLECVEWYIEEELKKGAKNESV